MKGCPIWCPRVSEGVPGCPRASHGVPWCNAQRGRKWFGSPWAGGRKVFGASTFKALSKPANHGSEGPLSAPMRFFDVQRSATSTYSMCLCFLWSLRHFTEALPSTLQELKLRGPKRVYGDLRVGQALRNLPQCRWNTFWINNQVSRIKQ